MAKTRLRGLAKRTARASAARRTGGISSKTKWALLPWLTSRQPGDYRRAGCAPLPGGPPAPGARAVRTARSWRGIVAFTHPRTGGAHDSHHRTAGIAGRTRRRGGTARGAPAPFHLLWGKSPISGAFAPDVAMIMTSALELPPRRALCLHRTSADVMAITEWSSAFARPNLADFRRSPTALAAHSRPALIRMLRLRP